jgi:large subunit ribosomal protein L5e
MIVDSLVQPKLRKAKKWEPDPDKHREYIFGIHVANYMRKLKEEDDEAYSTQFKRYIEAKVGPDDLEGAYTAVHKAIRADPTKKRDAKELGHWKVRKEPKKEGAKHKARPQTRKLTLSQRKHRIKQIVAARLKKQGGVAAAS